MATTYAIPDGRVAMAATTYTGNGSTQTISNAVNGVGMQPDFVWIKARSSAVSSSLTDIVRGVTNQLRTDATSAEVTGCTDGITFNSTGFASGAGSIGYSSNANGTTYVGWQWKAGGAAVSNTAGSITSSVSANTTAGFSVVTYTGTGANATVGHGLGSPAKLLLIKGRNVVDGWYVMHASNPISDYINLNNTNAKATAATVWNGSYPTSTVFSIGTSGAANGNGTTYVAYCFAPVAGYSAMGSYVGNGSTDGSFIYTGMRPRFIMVKRTDSTSNWYTYDSSRNTANPESLALYPNASYTEDTEIYVDFLSNGFKCRSATVGNISGATYIYAAFAENPFKYANAR